MVLSMIFRPYSIRKQNIHSQLRFLLAFVMLRFYTKKQAGNGPSPRTPKGSKSAKFIYKYTHQKPEREHREFMKMNFFKVDISC